MTKTTMETTTSSRQYFAHMSNDRNREEKPRIKKRETERKKMYRNAAIMVSDIV